MRLALKTILQERDEQDKQWGGSAGDDKNALHDWANFIRKQCDGATYQSIFPEVDVTEIRYHYVKIAALALALAAIESIDRLHGGI